ncbi:MAG: hypothetical protein AB1775_12710 [Bacteroidota bacterium]
MHENNDNEIVESFTKTMWHSGLEGISEEVLELPLDSILKDESLKDIPIIGYMFKASHLIITIRDRLFLQKVLKFLKELKTIDANRRNNFSKRITTDLKFRNKLTSNLLLLIERQENIDKASILGKVFRAYINEDVDYKMFMRLSSVIDKSFLEDLQNITSYYNDIDKIEISIGENLYRSGLVDVNHGIKDLDENNTIMGYTTKQYLRNDLGTSLAMIISKY